MASASPLTPLFVELDGFEARVRTLLLEIVAQVARAELDRRATEEPPPAKARRGRPPKTPATPAATTPAPDLAQAALATWSRDAVIDQLAKMLLGGGPVEASFLVRHRQRALVTNAKKFFGRFEAALNAANLKLAREYPEGIPSKKALPRVGA